MATAFSLDEFIDAPPLERARRVAAGLPIEALRELMRDPAVTVANLTRVVGPRRTLDRRLRHDSALSPEESDRLASLVAILALACQVFGSRTEGIAWLQEPKVAFDGQVPLDLLKTGPGARVVEDHLLRLRYGFYA